SAARWPAAAIPRAESATKPRRVSSVFCAIVDSDPRSGDATAACREAGLLRTAHAPDAPEGCPFMRPTTRERVDLGHQTEEIGRRPPRSYCAKTTTDIPVYSSCSSLLSVARLGAGR